MWTRRRVDDQIAQELLSLGEDGSEVEFADGQVLAAEAWPHFAERRILNVCSVCAVSLELLSQLQRATVCLASDLCPHLCQRRCCLCQRCLAALE